MEFKKEKSACNIESFLTHVLILKRFVERTMTVWTGREITFCMAHSVHAYSDQEPLFLFHTTVLFLKNCFASIHSKRFSYATTKTRKKPIDGI